MRTETFESPSEIGLHGDAVSATGGDGPEQNAGRVSSSQFISNASTPTLVAAAFCRASLGATQALVHALHQVELGAVIPTSVLILGETGKRQRSLTYPRGVVIGKPSSGLARLSEDIGGQLRGMQPALRSTPTTGQRVG
jgi:hypothetical protein